MAVEQSGTKTPPLAYGSTCVVVLPFAVKAMCEKS